MHMDVGADRGNEQSVVSVDGLSRDEEVRS